MPASNVPFRSNQSHSSRSPPKKIKPDPNPRGHDAPAYAHVTGSEGPSSMPDNPIVNSYLMGPKLVFGILEIGDTERNARAPDSRFERHVD